MKLITLKPNGTGRYDDVSPFIITDNKLEIEIKRPNYNGEFYLIAENNGRTEKKLFSANGKITLENLTAGELNATVKHYLKGVLIKEYTIEPLILIEVDETLSAEPEIAKLQKKYKELSASFFAFREYAIKSFKFYKQASEARDRRNNALILSLLKFAVKDYTRNVYMGCGSIEKFIEEFGFELSEEEIKIIKGDIKDDED